MYILQHRYSRILHHIHQKYETWYQKHTHGHQSLTEYFFLNPHHIMTTSFKKIIWTIHGSIELQGAHGFPGKLF